MTFKAVTFDLMRVTPQDDGALYNALSNDKSRILVPFMNNMACTSSGLTVTINTGACIAKGRFIRISSPETVTVSANSSGYICFIIDLSKSNTFTGTPGSSDYVPTNNQVTIGTRTSLSQQDINATGQIYHFPITYYSATGSTVTLSPAENFASSDITVTRCADSGAVGSDANMATYIANGMNGGGAFTDYGGWVRCNYAGRYKYFLTGGVSNASGWRNINVKFQTSAGGTKSPAYYNTTDSQGSGGTVSSQGVIDLAVGDMLIFNANGTGTCSVQAVACYIERL